MIVFGIDPGTGKNGRFFVDFQQVEGQRAAGHRDKNVMDSWISFRIWATKGASGVEIGASESGGGVISIFCSGSRSPLA
jgi:hypothetical protein